MRSGDRRNEELGTIRIGPFTGICHSQNIWSIKFHTTRNLIFEVLVPNTFTTCTITQWITRLQHEFLDDSMEDNPFVIGGFGVSCEILDCFRGDMGIESELNVSESGVKGSGCR